MTLFNEPIKDINTKVIGHACSIIDKDYWSHNHYKSLKTIKVFCALYLSNSGLF